MSIKSISKVCAASVAMLVLTCLAAQSAQAQESKADQICKSLYDTYREMGEAKFAEKFGAKKNSKDCIGLYKNPNWTFKGKNKIDSFYEQKQAEKNKIKAESKIFWTKHIGNGNYLVKFNICTKDERIAKPAVLIESRSSKILLSSYFAIQSNSCKSYQAQAKALSSGNEFSIKFVANTADPEFKSIKTVRLEN